VSGLVALLRRLMRNGDAEPASVPAPFAEIDAANARLRDTAKWILTSFAAVGALLVAGLQLSSLGELTGDTPDSRIFAALVGIAAAAFGVALAIWCTSTVLAPFLNTFGSADEEIKTARKVLADREIVGETYDELKEKIAHADTAIDEAATKHGRDSPEYVAAVAAREEWEPLKQLALASIGSKLLWRRYARARKGVVVAIALVTAGVVAFAWGANAPEEEKETPVVLGEAPLLLDVTLTPAGVEALAKKRACEQKTLMVLSIGGEEGKREVVTIPRGSCRAVRFVLSPNLGTATAAG